MDKESEKQDSYVKYLLKEGAKYIVITIIGGIFVFISSFYASSTATNSRSVENEKTNTRQEAAIKALKDNQEIILKNVCIIARTMKAEGSDTRHCR